MISEVPRPPSNTTENSFETALTPMIACEPYPLELFHQRAEMAATRRKEMEEAMQRKKLMQRGINPEDLAPRYSLPTMTTASASEPV